MMEKVIVSWSGGKDSALSLYEIQRDGNYQVVSLLTSISEPHDRVSMHGVRRTLLEQQSRALGLPLIKIPIPRECSEEEYESRLMDVLGKVKSDGINHVVFGDIFLEWIKEYREKNLSRLGMTPILPIWGRETLELTRSFISLGFKAVITCVNTKLMPRSFLGKVLDENFLSELPPGVDPAGENGEFHSFVFAGPIFRQSIPFALGRTVTRDSYYFRDLLPSEGSADEKRH
ncbi:MAG: diphthine--ammonia ligase [Chloroflexota bacterium]